MLWHQYPGEGFTSVAAVFGLTVFCSAADRATAAGRASPTTPIYMVANQDIGFPTPNAITLYLAQGTQLTYQNTIGTGGFGIQGGFFGTQRSVRFRILWLLAFTLPTLTATTSLQSPCRANNWWARSPGRRMMMAARTA